MAAHATQSGGIELRNTTQDQLWIVEEVHASTTTAGEWKLWVAEARTADFYATSLLASQLDTRIPGSSSQDLGSRGTGLVTPPGYNQIDMIRCGDDALCTFRPGVILAPGGSFIANSGDANLALWMGLTFHTRQAMPGELS